MDRRERIDDPVTSLQAMLQGFQFGLWTALPGILEGFDAAKVTASVQPAIQSQFRDTKGSWSNITLPLCLDCPVIFPGGGGFGLTFPLSNGDEGLIVFAKQCIDAWWQSGGVQPQAELRMHDLSDGFFIPGVFSQPRKPAAVSTTAVRLRANDGSAFLEIAPGGVCNMTFPGGVNIAGPVHVNGALNATGEVTGNGIPLSTHKHTGVTTGSGETGGPTP